MRIATAVLVLGVAACSSTQSSAPPQGGATMTTKSDAALAYERECQDGLARARAALQALETDTALANVATVLEPLNQLWILIDKGVNTAGLYRSVHPDAGLREVADTCEQEFSKIVTDIGLSRPLYDRVVAMSIANEDPATKRYVEHLLRDFRRAGVDKDTDTRERVRTLKDELVTIGQEFSKNIREDVRTIHVAPADLAGLPQDFIDAHPVAADGKVAITTDYPDYYPFMSYAKSDSARLELYREFRKRGHPANLDVLQTMLAKRFEIAQLLGYRNWAHYVTEDKMIKTAEAARTFIDRIHNVANERAQRDYNELLVRLQREFPAAKTVGDWQKSYIEEIVKQEKYNYDSQALRQYFTYGGVRDGLFALTSRMFGVEYRRVEAAVWDSEVEAYELVDSGRVIGKFFLDMVPRKDKYKHAAAFPILTGVQGQQVPQAALVCNFSKEGPMEHDQVETFFHEFGHLLHHLFAGEHRWVGVSGFNTEWDFVEAPSQMLEEWAWDGATLKTFAKNDKGETLPDNLIAAMRRARDFGKGLWVAHQMFYAAVSLNYYDRNPTTVDTTQLMKKLQDEYSPFDYVDDTYFQLSFGHLDGYSAIYYTYMWSLVIAKDLFSVFENQGLLNPAAAKRYRDNVLAPGGSKDADVMVREFLNRDYTFDAFAKWLNGA